MKNLLSLFVLVTIVSATQAQYSEVETYDYKIEVPKRWFKVSKNVIQELDAKHEKVDYRHYILGYSAYDSMSFALPCMMLNYEAIPGSENVLFKDVIEIERKILKRSYKKVEFVVDSAEYKFYAELDTVGGKVFSAFSLGKSGILYLNYICPAEDAEENKKVFLHILHSIRQKEEFQNRNHFYEEAAEHKKKAGESMKIALIALGALILIYFVRKRFNSNSEETIK